MQVVRYPSAESFLAKVEPFLLEAEAENALILGVAHALACVAADPTRVPYFAAVHDADAPVLAAFSNHPDRLGVTQAADPMAISLLARDLVDACPGLRTIGGPEPTAQALASELARLTGRECEHRLSMRIHRLDSIASTPRPVAGQFRAATEGDLLILTPWVERFHEETRTPGDPGPVAQDRLREGRLFVWDNRGPVAMAAWSGKTPNGARVNLVFTPPEHRGQGYAASVVTALSRLLLDGGNRFCTLYTDLANPTSNAIYARIGYRPVCDAGLHELGPGLVE